MEAEYLQTLERAAMQRRSHVGVGISAGNQQSQQQQRNIRDQLADIEKLSHELRERVQLAANMLFGPAVSGALNDVGGDQSSEVSPPITADLDRIETTLRRALTAVARFDRLG